MAMHHWYFGREWESAYAHRRDCSESVPQKDANIDPGVQMAKTVTARGIEEFFSAMTKEEATDWLISMGIYDPSKIEYSICQVTYDWFTLCTEWEEPSYHNLGQFCGGIETMRFTHPVLPEREITFSFYGDTMIDCYSVLKK